MKAFKRPHPLLIGLALAVALPAGVLLGVFTSHDADGGPPAVEQSPQGDPNMAVFTVQVDGRSVSCVALDPPGAALAMSCDWARAS